MFFPLLIWLTRNEIRAISWKMFFHRFSLSAEYNPQLYYLKFSHLKTYYRPPPLPKLFISVNGFLSIWRKHLPTVNAAVCARVRASWWCSQVAKPHFGKIVPKCKTAYRLYFSPNSDAKNSTEMPRKLPFMWCYFLVEMLAHNVHISLLTLGKMGHRISHFRWYFQKTKTVWMFRRWPFLLTLKEFLTTSNPLQSYSHFF